MEKIKGYGAQSSDAKLKQMEIERREVKPNDVKIKITYCGVCHSDIHTVEDDWGNAKYPVVPGHEIIGRVVEVGDKVKTGDLILCACLNGDVSIIYSISSGSSGSSEISPLISIGFSFSKRSFSKTYIFSENQRIS